MASATVDQRHNDHNHLHIESIPVVDLRLLSHPELLSLYSCSASPSPSIAETELFTPKIDRSVFNESAGSRKQTFFRLRFAAPGSSHLLHHHDHSCPPSKPFSFRPLLSNPEPPDEESSNVLSVLKSLFNIDDSVTANPIEIEPYEDKDLVPVQVEYPNGNPVLENIPVDIVSCSVRKRKRGRPRKDEKDNWGIEGNSLVIEENKETAALDRVNETANGGSISSCSEGKRKRGRPRKEQSQNRVIGCEEKKVETEIGRVELENLEAILGIEEELRKRTEGMETEEELSQFMGGLEGEWASKSQKKRIVDAGGFGNVLPQGWKLMLFVKRRAGLLWLACSRYISPDGQQFVSCKEVSSYLLSSGGPKDASLETSSHTDPGNGLGVKPSSENLPSTCISSGHEKRAPSLRMGSPREVQRAETIKCHKCTMTFNQQDDFIGHLLSSHQGTAKSSGLSTSTNQEVIIKNKNEKTLVDKNCDKQNQFCITTDNKGEVTAAGGGGGGCPAASDLNVCFSSEKVLFAGDKNGISQSSDNTDVRFAHNSMEEKKREMSSNTSLLASNSKGNMFNDEDDGKHFTSFQKAMETGWKDKVAWNDPKAGCANTQTGPRNVRFDVERKNYASQILSSKKQRGNLVDHVKEASVTVNSAQARGSGSGVPSSEYDQRFVSDNNLIRVSTGALDNPEPIVVSESGNNHSTIGFQSNLRTKKPSQDERKDALHTLRGREQIFASDSNAFKVSSQTCQVSELVEAQKSSGLIQGVSSHHSGLDANILASFQHDRSKNHSFFPASYAKTFSCAQEELKQDKRSESNVHEQYAYNYESSMNKFSFTTMEEPKHKVESSLIGNTHTRIGTFAQTGIGQESYSPFFSGNGKKVVGKNNVPGISSGAVHEPKQNKGAFEQTHVTNNLNMVYAGTAHDASRLQDFQNARNNEITMGSNNHARPTEDSLTGLTWKSDEGNILMTGFADASSHLFQSSGYYPTFNLTSHKGESQPFNNSGKDCSIPGFEGLRSDGREHMEYNFLTAQPSSHSGNSKAYDSEMALRFDSSVWPGKEALPLFPKIAGGHQVPILCSWCGDEFYHEAVNGEQRSSMTMCANCRARFSRIHDFM
ncbi:hypothetical protein PTKIN_Ptkin01aG0041600 [Pterospermum kingtungense]